MPDQRPRPGLSYQLYSSRKFPPLGETIATLGQLGFDQAEGYGGVYDQAVDLRRALDTAGMTMPTGHFPLAMLASDPEKVIGIADRLGMSTIFCPSLGVEDYPVDAAGWQGFGERLGRIASRLAAAGLRFGWRNHDSELQALSGGGLPLYQLSLPASAPHF